MDSGRTDAMKYTDLCARLDADIHAHDVTGNGNLPRVQNTREAAAAIRELEAERSHWMNEARRTLKAGQDALERAEAAEARVAELSRERDAVEVEPVAWRQEDRCHPGWYYYGDAATEVATVGAQLLYAKPQAPAPDAVEALAKAAEFLAWMQKEGHAVECADEAWTKLRAALATIRKGAPNET
jgi:hypothetical protein